MARGETHRDRQAPSRAARPRGLENIFSAGATAAPKSVRLSSSGWAPRTSITLGQQFEQAAGDVQARLEKEARRQIELRLETLAEDALLIANRGMQGFDVDARASELRPLQGSWSQSALATTLVERRLIGDLLVAEHVLADEELQRRIRRALERRFRKADRLLSGRTADEQKAFQQLQQLYEAGLPASKMMVVAGKGLARSARHSYDPSVSGDSQLMAQLLIQSRRSLEPSPRELGLALADLACSDTIDQSQLLDAAWRYVQLIGSGTPDQRSLLESLSADDLRMVLRMAGLRCAVDVYHGKDTYELAMADRLAVVWEHNPAAPAEGFPPGTPQRGLDLVGHATRVVASIGSLTARSDASARAQFARADLPTPDVVSGAAIGTKPPATAQDVDFELRRIAMHPKRYLGHDVPEAKEGSVVRVTQRVEPAAVGELLARHRGERDVRLDIASKSAKGSFQHLRVTLTRGFGGAGADDVRFAHHATFHIDLKGRSHQQRQREMTAALEQVIPGFGEQMQAYCKEKGLKSEWARGEASAFGGTIRRMLADKHPNLPVADHFLDGAGAKGSVVSIEPARRYQSMQWDRSALKHLRPDCTHPQVRWEDEALTASVVAVCSSCGERPLKIIARHRISAHALESVGLKPSDEAPAQVPLSLLQRLSVRRGSAPSEPAKLGEEYLLRERIRDLAAGRVSCTSYEELRQRDSAVDELVWESREPVDPKAARPARRRLRV